MKAHFKTARLAVLAVLAASLLRADGLISHLAVGYGWTTTITLVNTTTFSQPMTVSFWDNYGELPLNITGLGNYSAYTVTLPPSGVSVVELTGSQNSLQSGYATVEGRTVAGNAIFRWIVEGNPDFEASVPISPAVQKIVFPFDNSPGFLMGIALANAKTDSSYVQMVIRDGLGRLITNTRPPNVQHQSFILRDAYPETDGLIGTIEFVAFSKGGGTPPIATISAIALRFNPTGPFTTLTPVYMGDF